MFKKLLILVSLLFVFAGAAISQESSNGTAATTAPAKPKKAPIFRATKDQIKEAQTMLKSKNGFGGEATGVSSPEWKTAVKAYQKENGLTKTGSLNRATVEKMGIALTDKQKEIPVNPNHIASGSSDTKKKKSGDGSSSSTTAKTEVKTSDGPKRPAPFQANKDQIMALQTKLKEAKLFSAEATGERSDDLKTAIKKYQEANGLKATGGINAATLEKAGIALTDKQKEQVAAQAAYDAAKTPKN